MIGLLAGKETGRIEGSTDLRGNFTYTSLGMVADYKQVTISARVVNTQADYRISSSSAVSTRYVERSATRIGNR